MAAHTSEKERDAMARTLRRRVRGDVRFGRHDRMLYATDASLYQVEPLGVVIPADIEDAVEAISWCAQVGLSILPRGGGTSLAGQCVNRAVVIDFSANCRDVGDVDAARNRVRAAPGVTLDELNAEIERQGHRLFFAPDVATSAHANLGGMIGNNSAGARSVLYGRTVEHVIGLDVARIDEQGHVKRLTFDESSAGRDEEVAAIGRRVADVARRHEDEIRTRFPSIIRRVSGYNLDLILKQLDQRGSGGGPDSATRRTLNLAPLVVGSEGTLAVTLGAELNLTPTPVARGLAIAAFDSLADAIEAVNPILETRPSAVELLDDMVISLARLNSAHRSALELLPRSTERSRGGADPSAALMVEYFAFESADELRERFAMLRRIVQGIPMAELTAPADMRRAWSLRKAAEPLLHGLPGLRKPITFVEDTAVDPKRLPEFVTRFRGIVEAHGARAAYYAHASVGCLHIRPMLDPHDPADRERLRDIASAVADLVIEFGGALSGEHGDGRVRGPFLERMFGRELMGAFREIKTIFDPKNLLNPGNIVEAGGIESITTSLRVLPEREPIVVPDVETFFEYSDSHGFADAVERCNGAGVCRKKQGGTMCPSFMATLDERHSTRGRGNALRLAITGQFGAAGAPDWDDEETIRTLDLCLSCKACKSECPSNVDIARLKSEYTGQRYREGARPPLGDRVMTNLRMIQKLASRAPRLANWLQSRAAMRAVMNRAFGLAPERSLPEFGASLCSALVRRARETQRARLGEPCHRGDDGWDARSACVGPTAERVKVGIFADCFTGFGESRIGLAAVEVLERLGCEVGVIDAGCCQRPAISLGLLDRAVKRGERFFRAMTPAAEDEAIKAILFLEPSCLSAIVDDLPALKMNVSSELRRRLSAKSMSVEEFVCRALTAHGGTGGCAGSTAETPVPPARGGPVMLHGHCHQQAIGGIGSSAAMLRALVGDRLTVLDSGCCGMAGAFGMSRARYSLSMKIGERSLLPAVRTAPADATIVATGSSCRHQIRDGAARIAVHPVEVAADILRKRPAPERG